MLPKNHCLVLIDNHSSHLSSDVLDYCKTHGITLLSFPPHCSHKLQPLDLSVYGPLKKYINSACDDWITTNKRPMTIYDIPSIVKTALPLAATPVNITAGFRKSGIFPLNKDIFTDADFMPSYITDRPNPDSTSEPTAVTTPSLPLISTSPLPGPSGINQSSSKSLGGNDFPSPDDVRPFLKAEPRKNLQRRRKRSSAVLTDTPVKQALQEEQMKAKQKKENMLQKQKEKFQKRLFSEIQKSVRKAKRQRRSKKYVVSEDEEEQDNLCLCCLKSFETSKPGEQWVQCTMCKRWAHESCVAGETMYYVCLHCNDENDAEESN